MFPSHDQFTKKYNKDDFKRDLHTTEEQFYQDLLSEQQFAKQYVRLRLSYGQKPNETSEIRYFMYHIMKKDLRRADEYAISTLEKAQNKISAIDI